MTTESPIEREQVELYFRGQPVIDSEQAYDALVEIFGNAGGYEPAPIDPEGRLGIWRVNLPDAAAEVLVNQGFLDLESHGYELRTGYYE
jgi:hypothetical protein